MNTEAKTQVAIRFPDSLKLRAELVATDLGLSFSDIVRLAVNAQLPDLERGDFHKAKNRGVKNHA